MAVFDNVSATLADGFSESLQGGAKVRIAAATFSLFAFDALKKELKKSKNLEFIFTAPSFVEDDAVPASVTSFQRELAEVGERYLSGSPLETALLNEMNHHRIAQECFNWIESNKVSFKANVSESSLQSFAVVTPDEQTNEHTAFSPLNGFTASTLGKAEAPRIPQLVSSFGSGEAKKYLELFTIVWNDTKLLIDVTDAVKEALATLFERNSPAFVYYVILFNIFTEFLDNLEEDFLPNDLTGFKETKIWQSLFNFQKDAATGVINKLEQFNGCILADSVGLGKTYTALAVIKYFELRNKNVLVLAPKKLTANWTTYNQPHITNTLLEDRFNYKVLAHTDLSRDTGMSGDIDLALLNWGNFDLVVIDESHNFRNPGTSQFKETRYDKLLRKVVREGVETKVLMLSATPVNNKFTDLRNQLALAVDGREDEFEQSAQLSNNLETTFRLAQKQFNEWSKLDAEERTPQKIMKMLNFDFFELLDAVTIARSRKQIQRNYDTQAVGAFPTRLKPISARPKLTTLERVPSFEELNNELLKLNLAVYAPLESVHPSLRSKYEDQRGIGNERNMTATGRSAGLKKLMAVNLLKRLESSVEAFRLTLTGLEQKLIDSIAAVDAYEEFRENGGIGVSCATVNDETALLDDVEGEEGDIPDAPDSMVGGEKRPIDLADMNYIGWRDKLEADLVIISSLLEKIAPVEKEFDAKLQRLVHEIERKLENPINEGNKKVLVFTAFADTADYLFDSLKDQLASMGLNSAVVTGSNRPRNTLGRSLDFQQTLTLFSPVSKSREVVMPDETREIDVLIGTDCISEGQNLQDCDYLINYDIHWNPVRIIQRFGRVDRIGSNNKEIQLINFWPSIDLDEYINLKERVEGRMIIADLSGTADDNILMSKADRAEADYRKQQLERLQDEVLDLEDANTGVSITDLGLNDFRMDLVAYLREFGSLENTPKGVYAVVPADEDAGIVPGAFFAVRDTTGKSAHRGNRLHPYYLLYVSDSGEQVVEHTDVKAVLDRLRLAAASYTEPIEELCDEFDVRTKKGTDLSHYKELLQNALKTIDVVGEQREVEDLFDGTLGAKAQSIASAKKHELIAFIAVLDGSGVRG